MTYDAGRPCCEEYERMQQRIKELEIKLQPIETAPHDGTEIFLVSIQNIEDTVLISIHNGYWRDNSFHLGQPEFDLRIGDECATHWLPRNIIAKL